MNTKSEADSVIAPSRSANRVHRASSVTYPVDLVLISTNMNVGGVEKTIRNLARGLPPAEFHPHVIGLKSPGRLGEELDELGISWESLDIEPPPHPGVLFQLVNRLEEINPDVVHSFLFHANMLGRISASLSGVPVIISTVRECDPNRTHLMLDGLTQVFVDREVCAAPAVRGYTHTEAGVPSEKLVCIPGGVDPKTPEIEEGEKERLKKRVGGLREGPLLIGAGRLMKKKGFDSLIKALPRLVSVHEHLKCVIFGEGPQEEELLELIEQRELSDHVVLAGWTDQLRKWFSLADLFILSSRRAGLPDVLLEAIAMEVPFVATRTGGIPDLLRDVERPGGILVDADSARMLSTAIEDVLDNPVFFEKGVRRFGEVIREKYSVSKMIARHHSLYKDLLSG